MIDGVSFNTVYWAHFQIDDFIDEGMRLGLFPDYDDDDRKKLLMRAFELVNEYRTVQ